MAAFANPLDGYHGNILDAFFEKRYDILERLASNAETDFTVIRKKEGKTFSNPLGYNVFHFCFAPAKGEGPALNRLLRIKKGVDALGQRTNSLLLALSTKSSDGKTPLHLAAASSFTEKACKLAELLLEMGADPSIPNDQGETPSQRALRGYGIGLRMQIGASSIPAIHHLLAGAESKNKSLFECFKLGKFGEANRYLDKLSEGDEGFQMNVKEPDNQGNNLLMLAIKGGREHGVQEEELLHILKKLVSLGVDSNQMNAKNETALSLTVAGGYVSIVEYLLFEIKIDIKKHITPVGDTILHIAAKERATLPMIKLLLTCVEVKKLLHYRNSNNQLPLHFVKRSDVCEEFCTADPKTLTQDTIAELRKIYGRIGGSHYHNMSAILDSYDKTVPPPPVPMDFRERGEDLLNRLSDSVILPVVRHAGEATVELGSSMVDFTKEEAKNRLPSSSPASSSDT